MVAMQAMGGRGVASRQPFAGGQALPSVASAAQNNHRLSSSSRRGCCTTRAASVIRDLHAQLSSKQLSVSELTAEYLRRLDAAEPTVQSFITVTAEQAMQQVG